jgi:hypothetical protein
MVQPLPLDLQKGSVERTVLLVDVIGLHCGEGKYY